MESGLLRILYSANLFFKSKGEIKTFSEKQKALEPFGKPLLSLKPGSLDLVSSHL